MVTELEKQAFVDRVNKLRINTDAVEKVVVHMPNGDVALGDAKSRTSAGMFANATTNDGYIDADAARALLEVYGPAYLAETDRKPSDHKAIFTARVISNLRLKVRSDVFRRADSKKMPEHIRVGIDRITRERGHPTPFYVYDASGIDREITRFNDAFSWDKGFVNFFAVKALPNPNIIEMMARRNWGADCSSDPELDYASAAGMVGERMMFTSNDTPDEEFVSARKRGAILNLDDITHIAAVERATGGLPELISFRFNPGSAREGTEIIGQPEEAKYGLTTEQIHQAYGIAKSKGVKRFVLHTMIVSNMRDGKYIVETGKMMARLAKELEDEHKIKFEFINIGGGVGIPYRPEHRGVDLGQVSAGISMEFRERWGGKAPSLFMECGRAITGPHGWLISSVRHVMEKYKTFVGMDACMANLMRPGMYGAYHHITVLGKENEPLVMTADVVGSLCEGIDKFAVNRLLPAVQRGDKFAVWEGGAHSHAMCFQYNAKLRCAEFLVDGNGNPVMIRRAETRRDYAATLDFPGSKYSDLARE